MIANQVRKRQRRNLSTSLAAQIAEHLILEKLSPGTHLGTQDFADLYEVSRSPINQALKLLCEQGVIIYRPNQGYFVADIDPSHLKQPGHTPGTDLTAIYFRIAEDRLSGKLGDQVSESLLRDRYDLTRDQLSQLLSRISQEGWAERRPGYGWTFSAILTTPEALEQTYRLRIAIEPAAILEPTFQFDRRWADKLRTVEKSLLAGGFETESADTLYERGVRFHEVIVEASGNPFFLEALRRVNRIRRLLVYRSMSDRSRYYGQAKEHLKILDLLETGRREDAAEAMRRHLQSVSRKNRSASQKLDKQGV
jgi:DNA-binding GntR family transcriptional regulator